MNEKELNLERIEDEALIKYAGQRVIIMFAGTFQQLTKSIQDEIGMEAKGVLFDAGIFSGRHSTRVLLNSWKERGESFLKKWGEFYSSSGVGWFKIVELNIDLNIGTGKIVIKQSMASEKEKIVDNFAISENANIPSCDFLTGFFVGVFEELTGNKIQCEEVHHANDEHQYCEFKLINY